MSHAGARPPDHRYAREIEAERQGWYELVDLVRSLTPEECLVPGYYRDPAWTVRDVIAHLGTWMAEAQIQFERLSAGTYEGHDIDVDALNAAFLAAMQGQPWDVAWVQANAGRTMMVQTWHALRDPRGEAAWWIRKSGATTTRSTWGASASGPRNSSPPAAADDAIHLERQVSGFR